MQNIAQKPRTETVTMQANGSMNRIAGHGKKKDVKMGKGWRKENKNLESPPGQFWNPERRGKPENM